MSISDLAYISPAGYIYADYPTFLKYIQDSYRAIYGNDVYLEPDSQDGQFLAFIALAFYDTAALGAAVYNSFSPLTAQGAGLARLGKLNGLRKIIATKSTVDLVISGSVGTTITNGVAVDSLNQKWFLPASVTIPNAGFITVTASAEFVGSVAAVANTINRIFTPTQGWQTVTNALAASPGVPVESDAAFRARQTVSTSNRSLTVFEGTKGAVANVPGVTNIRGYENDTSATDANGIPPHTISMVVDGGDALTIARTIAQHKTPGTGTYGTTSQSIYDSHGMPLVINFYRPTVVTVNVIVTVQALYGYSTGYNTLIAQAVANLINSLGIGSSVLTTKLYVPANLPGTAPGTTFNIVTLQVARGSGTPTGGTLAIAFNEIAHCDPLTNVTVTVVP